MKHLSLLKSSKAKEKIPTKWVIRSEDKDFVNVIDHVSFDEYNKEVITNEFVRQVEKLKDGENVDYFRQDNKWFYNSLLTIENVKGVLKRIGKDGRYRVFNIENLKNIIKES